MQNYHVRTGAPCRGFGTSRGEPSQRIMKVGGTHMYDSPPNWNPQPAFYPESHQPPPDKYYKDVQKPVFPMGQEPMMNAFYQQPPLPRLMELPFGKTGFAHCEQPQYEPAGNLTNVQYCQQGSHHQPSSNNQQGPYHHQQSFHHQGSYHKQGYFYQQTPNQQHGFFYQQGPNYQLNSIHQQDMYQQFGSEAQSMTLGAPMSYQQHFGYHGIQQVVPITAPLAPWQKVLEQLPGEIARMQRKFGLQFPPGLHYLPFVVMDNQPQLCQSQVRVERVDDTHYHHQQLSEKSVHTAVSMSAGVPDVPTVWAVNEEVVNISNDYQDASDVFWEVNETGKSCDLNAGFAQPANKYRLEEISEDGERSGVRCLSADTSFHTPESRRLAADDVPNASQEFRIDQVNVSASTQDDTTCQEQRGSYDDSLMSDSSVEEYDDAHDMPTTLPSVAPPTQIVPYLNAFVPGDMTTIYEEGSFFEDCRNSADSRMSSRSITPTPQCVNTSSLLLKDADGQKTPTGNPNTWPEIMSTHSERSNQPANIANMLLSEPPAHSDSDSLVDWDTSSETSLLLPPTGSSGTENSPKPPAQAQTEVTSAPAPQTVPINNKTAATADADSSVDWNTSLEASFIPTTTERQTASPLTTEQSHLDTIASQPSVLVFPIANQLSPRTTSSNSANHKTVKNLNGGRTDDMYTMALVSKPTSASGWITVGPKRKAMVTRQKHSVPSSTKSVVNWDSGRLSPTSDKNSDGAGKVTSLEMSAGKGSPSIAPPTAVLLSATNSSSSSKVSQATKSKTSKRKKSEKINKSKFDAQERKKKQQDEEDMLFLNTLTQNTTTTVDAKKEHRRAMLEEYCRTEQIRRRNPVQDPNPSTFILQKRVDDYTKKHSVLSKQEKDKAKKFIQSRLAHHEKSPEKISELAVPLYKIMMDNANHVVFVDGLCLRTAYSPIIEMGWLSEVFSEVGVFEAAIEVSPTFCAASLHKFIDAYISKTKVLRSQQPSHQLDRSSFFDEFMTRSYLISFVNCTEKKRIIYSTDFFKMKAKEFLEAGPLKAMQRAQAQMCLALSERQEQVLEEDKYMLTRHPDTSVFRMYLNNIFSTFANVFECN